MRQEGPRRLLTGAWLGRHLLFAGLVGAFLALGWWQIGRAASGNALSWAYAVEWPVFAGFVIFVWTREVKRELRAAPPDTRPPATRTGFRPPVITTRAARPSRRSSATGTARPPAEDCDLAAYNHFLAWLNANPGARPADYPGAESREASDTAAAPDRTYERNS